MDAPSPGRFLAVGTLAMFLTLALPAQADHPEVQDGHYVEFDHRGGNEWWVETHLVADVGDAQVQAQDEGGLWTDLEKRSWGNWAGSFHIEPGHDVRFRLQWPDRDQVVSCWFDHPSGDEGCPFSTEPATYFGISQRDSGVGVAVAPDGNVLVYGDGGSDTRAGELFADLAGGVGWTDSIGGSDDEDAQGVAAADDGDALIVGTTDSADFPTTTGLDRSYGGSGDGYVARIDEVETVWSTYLGGSGHDRVTAVEHVPGAVYVSGWTSSCDFPTTAGAYQHPAGDCRDAFLARLGDDGTVQAATVFGGSGSERAFDLAVMPGGDVVLYGETRSTDMPTTPGAYDRDKPGEHTEDLYVARFNPDLATLRHATFFGSPTASSWHDGAVDADASGITITGSTSADDWPTTPGAWATGLQSPTGCQDGPASFDAPCADAFVSKFSPDLSGLEYSTYLGGSGTDRAFGITLDPQGRAHVAGSTNGGDFVEPANGRSVGFRDGFHALLAADGSAIERRQALGGEDWDEAHDIAYRDGEAYVAGFTESRDFGISRDAAFKDLSGIRDMFVARVAHAAEPATFDHNGGNEWWVQVAIDGVRPDGVQAQDTHGAWTELEKKDWGDWAASFPIEPGHDVRFRALVDGSWQPSCWFTHPDGVSPDGDGACMGPESGSGDGGDGGDGDTADFDASFSTSGGNEWWVEVYVDANEPLAAVHARDDGGAWIALEKKSWGAWAKSFHVEDGSLVDFRATSTDGSADISGQYQWPEGTQVTQGPDGDDPPPPATTDVAFGPKAGNEWWVETLAVGDGEPIDQVEARAGDGAWHELSYRDWGAWAVSFHVPAGEDVTFRAMTATGSDTSDAFHWPDATLVGGDGSWPEEGSYVMTNTIYRNPAPEVDDKDHTMVYHDGVWWRHSVGYEEDPGGRQETESWGEGSVSYHPTDVAVGDTYEHGGKTVTVTGAGTYEAHREGDAVTVRVYEGEWTADCGCDYDLYEWDRDLGLEVYFYNGGTEIWGERLLDTDAPIATV